MNTQTETRLCFIKDFTFHVKINKILQSYCHRGGFFAEQFSSLLDG